MILHRKIRSMPGGAGNYGDYLAKLGEQAREKDGPDLGSYYSKNEAVRGMWQGELAKKWGIEGKEILPGDKIFAALNDGLDPKGKPLGQRTIKERKPTFTQAFTACRRELGRKPTEEEARAKLATMNSEGPIRFYDFTSSVPKALSIAIVTCNDEALRKLVQDSYKTAVAEELAKLAARRVRDEGALPDARETTGSAICGFFPHDLSRDGIDPNFHMHACFANVVETPDGTRYALEAADMAKAKNLADAKAMSAIAMGAKKLGYELEIEKDARGNVVRWDIAGISRKARERMSGQHKKIEAAIAEYERRNGFKPSRKEEDLLQRREAEKMRKNSREVMTPEIRSQQIARLGDEWRGVTAVVSAAMAKRAKPPRANERREREEAEKAVASALRHLEERLQIWPRHVLESEALKASFGKAGPLEISRAVDSALAAEQGAVLVDRRDGEPDLMRAVSTPGAVRREFYSLDRIAANAGTCQPLAKFTPSPKHSAEQNAAVRAICETRDRVICVEGAAGTGKTHTMKYARTMLEKAGQEVLVIAPTRAAANIWKQDGFQATTIASYLRSATHPNPKYRRQHAGKTIFCDESGMVSGKAGCQILRLAEAENLNQRIALIGDHRQSHSVEAMNWLGVLLAHSPELAKSRVKLSEIRRQRFKPYREAVAVMGGCAKKANGEFLPASVAEGVRLLDKLGWIHEVGAEGMGEGKKEEKGGYIGAAARDYLAAIKYGQEYEVYDGGEKIDSAILVAPTHEELRALTDVVRAELKSRGAIDGSKEKTRRVAISLGLTEEQMTRPERYGEGGEWIVAKEPIAGLDSGEMAMIREIVKVKKGRSEWHEMLLSNGGRCRISGRTAKKIDVAAMREVGFAPGDRVAIRQNRLPLTNGDVYTVASVGEDGSIKTTCGKNIPAKFSMIAHGYGGTVERSQGNKALRAVGCGATSDSERMYVLFSRGVDSCAFYCPDKANFMRSVGCSGQREAVLDELRSRQETRVEGQLRAAAILAGETKSQMSAWFVRVGENVRSAIRNHLGSPARFAIRMAGRMAQIKAREAARDAARQRREALAKAPALARAPRAETLVRSSGGRER